MPVTNRPFPTPRATGPRSRVGVPGGTNVAQGFLSVIQNANRLVGQVSDTRRRLLRERQKQEEKLINISNAEVKAERLGVADAERLAQQTYSKDQSANIAEGVRIADAHEVAQRGYLSTSPGDISRLWLSQQTSGDISVGGTVAGQHLTKIDRQIADLRQGAIHEINGIDLRTADFTDPAVREAIAEAFFPTADEMALIPAQLRPQVLETTVDRIQDLYGQWQGYQYAKSESAALQGAQQQIKAVAQGLFSLRAENVTGYTPEETQGLTESLQMKARGIAPLFQGLSPENQDLLMASLPDILISAAKDIAVVSGGYDLFNDMIDMGYADLLGIGRTVADLAGGVAAWTAKVAEAQEQAIDTEEQYRENRISSAVSGLRREAQSILDRMPGYTDENGNLVDLDLDSSIQLSYALMPALRRHAEALNLRVDEREEALGQVLKGFIGNDKSAVAELKLSYYSGELQLEELVGTADQLVEDKIFSPKEALAVKTFAFNEFREQERLQRELENEQNRVQYQIWTRPQALFQKAIEAQIEIRAAREGVLPQNLSAEEQTLAHIEVAELQAQLGHAVAKGAIQADEALKIFGQTVWGNRFDLNAQEPTEESLFEPLPGDTSELEGDELLRPQLPPDLNPADMTPEQWREYNRLKSEEAAGDAQLLHDVQEDNGATSEQLGDPPPGQVERELQGFRETREPLDQAELDSLKDTFAPADLDVSRAAKGTPDYKAFQAGEAPMSEGLTDAVLQDIARAEAGQAASTAMADALGILTNIRGGDKPTFEEFKAFVEWNAGVLLQGDDKSLVTDLVDAEEEGSLPAAAVAEVSPPERRYRLAGKPDADLVDKLNLLVQPSEQRGRYQISVARIKEGKPLLSIGNREVLWMLRSQGSKGFLQADLSAMFSRVVSYIPSENQREILTYLINRELRLFENSPEGKAFIRQYKSQK